MKAIPFVCICLLLLSPLALTESRRDNYIVFIAAMDGPLKIHPRNSPWDEPVLDGCHDCPSKIDWNGNPPARTQQDIIWYRDESREIAIIRAANQPFKINPFDDDPIGCDYFCDDIEVLLPPRPPCLVGNCEFEDTLSKTKYWRKKDRQG